MSLSFPAVAVIATLILLVLHFAIGVNWLVVFAPLIALAAFVALFVLTALIAAVVAVIAAIATTVRTEVHKAQRK